MRFYSITKRSPVLHIRMFSDVSSVKKLVFLGTPKVASQVLKILQNEANNNGYIISGVVSQPPSKSGRKKLFTNSPVHELAISMNLPIFLPEKATDSTFLETFEKLKPDLCITAAYGNYLPKRFLSVPKYGTINIHPSLLPKYRGAAPLQRCLQNGDNSTGVTLLETVSKMDAGPILFQYERILNGDEKVTDLLPELFTIGTNELLKMLPSVFDGSVSKRFQDESKVSLAEKLDVNESRVDFSIDSARTIHNKVRGFSDWPGVWTKFQVKSSSSDSESFSDNVRMKLITTTVIDDASGARANSSRSSAVHLVTHSKYGFVLEAVCGDGSKLGIVELQPEARKTVKARDYMNGLRGGQLYWAPTCQDPSPI